MEKPTLRIARIRSGWSQGQLAQVADISTVSISNLETGKHSPQDLTRKRIEIALGTEIDWQATKMQGAVLKNGHSKILAE